MRGKICSIPYVNKVKENVLGIKPEQLKWLLKSLKTHSIIIPVASGRSKHAMNIPLSQATLMKNPKTVLSLEGPEFPWGSIYEAAPVLEQRYRNQKILVLFNSGSGETEDTLNVAYDIVRYIAETKSKKFTLFAITSNRNSPLGKLVRELGHLLDLKSAGKREIDKKKNNSYVETGIMRDVFELGSCFLLQTIVDSMYAGVQTDDFYSLAEKEFRTIGRMIDSSVDSEFYKSAINRLETRCHVFRNSRGTGDEVAKMTLIRLDHIKGALGDDVYIINPPRPRAGDFQLSISYSGEAKTVVNMGRIFRQLGGHQFSIIGRKGSHLEQHSDSSLILEEEAKLGQPRKFYSRAAFVASPIPTKLIEKLGERGISLPEAILKYYHAVAE
jgi:D-arabinose 5-phosphate isomerase GutQ